MEPSTSFSIDQLLREKRSTELAESSGVRDVACPLCNEDDFSDLPALIEHVEEEHAYAHRPVACPVCRRTTKSLVAHLLQHAHLLPGYLSGSSSQPSTSRATCHSMDWGRVTCCSERSYCTTIETHDDDDDHNDDGEDEDHHLAQGEGSSSGGPAGGSSIVGSAVGSLVGSVVGSLHNAAHLHGRHGQHQQDQESHCDAESTLSAAESKSVCGSEAATSEAAQQHLALADLPSGGLLAGHVHGHMASQRSRAGQLEHELGLEHGHAVHHLQEHLLVSVPGSVAGSSSVAHSPGASGSALLPQFVAAAAAAQQQRQQQQQQQEAIEVALLPSLPPSPGWASQGELADLPPVQAASVHPSPPPGPPAPLPAPAPACSPVPRSSPTTMATKGKSADLASGQHLHGAAAGDVGAWPSSPGPKGRQAPGAGAAPGAGHVGAGVGSRAAQQAPALGTHTVCKLFVRQLLLSAFQLDAPVGAGRSSHGPGNGRGTAPR